MIEWACLCGARQEFAQPPADARRECWLCKTPGGMRPLPWTPTEAEMEAVKGANHD